MSLSLFISFQSRFVTYLLTYPRTSRNIINQTVKARCLIKPIYVHLLHHFEIHGKIVPLTISPVTLEAHEQDVWSELANT